MSIVEIILITLLVISIVAAMAFSSKHLNAEDRLKFAEADRDAYRNEYIDLKGKYMDLLLAIGGAKEDYIIKPGCSAYMVMRVFAVLDGKDIEILIKKFDFDNNDYADRANAKLEAEDLFDALNGKVGWRVNKDIG